MEDTPKKNGLRYALIGIPIAIFIAFSFFFYVYATPEEVIAWIGVEDAYFLMGILGFLSGAMTFSGIPYHLILISFSTGGLNPTLLAFAAAVGLAIGDSTSYFLGYHGSAIIPEQLRKILNRIRTIGERYPRMAPLIFFLYGALVPFSNDFIGITMGLARYSFWRIMIPLSLGTFVFNLGIAYFGIYIYELFI
ncbi:MAG: VTT domain-containing protein [Minisyncoccia bacterium]